MRGENEELQAQLLSNHVQEGRSLLMNGSTSLADEIENLPKDEVCNGSLDYISHVQGY